MACINCYLDTGVLYTWGRSDHGVLGRGDEYNQLLPKAVPMEDKVVKISAGFWHNLAVTGTNICFSLVLPLIIT